MATRFYLPSSGAAPVTPTLGSGWEVTTGYTTGPAPTTKSNTAITTVSGVQKGSTVANNDRLGRVFVSDRIAAQTITGTFSAVISALESATTADMWFQVMIRVLSEDGTTVRGTLYAGSTATSASATTTVENAEYGTTFSTRIKSAIALSSVAASAGDRISIEIGIRGAGTTSTDTFSHRYGDATATADFALTAALTTSLDPWVELSQTLTFMPVVSAGAAAGGPINTAFSRTATETLNGATATSRAWTILSGPTGVGTTIGTAAALSWTPTVAGDYTLRYTLTSSVGTSTSDVVYTASAGAYVAGVTVLGNTTAVATMTGAAPAGTAAGDLLIAMFSFGTNSNTVTGTQQAAGYTNIQSTQLTGGNSYGQSLYRVATGTSADNLTVNWTDWNNTGTAGATKGTGYLILIKGAAASGTIVEASTINSQSASNLDPAAITPAAGTAKDYLWLALFYAATNFTATAAPAGFINFQAQLVVAAAPSGAAIASRNTNGTTLDPGAWTHSSGSAAVLTLAISPTVVASGTAYSRSGGVTGTGTAAGSRRQASTRTGGVASAGVASGSRAQGSTRTGGVASAGVTAGSRTRRLSYSGGVASPGASAGSRSQRPARTGGVASPAATAASRTVNRAYTGGVAAAGTLAGSRSVATTYVRTGGVAGEGVSSGSRSQAFVKTGAAQASGASAGARVVVEPRTGGVAAAAALAGSRTRTVAYSGSIAVPAVLSGSRSQATAKTGGVSAAGAASGSRSVVDARSGGVASSAVLAGTHTRTVARAGGVTSDAVLAGSRMVAESRTGVVAAAVAVAGARMVAASRTGVVVGEPYLAGSHSGALARVGGVAPSAGIAGSRQVTSAKTGAATASGAAAGSRAVRMARTGGISASAALAGSGRGDGPPPVIRSGGVSAAAAISGRRQIAHTVSGGVTGTATLVGSRQAVRTRTGGIAASLVVAGSGVDLPATTVSRSGGVVLVAVIHGSGYAIAANQPALVVGGTPHLSSGPGAGRPTITPGPRTGIPRVSHPVVAGQPHRRRV